LLALQRLVVRTQAGPLRRLWASCYAVAVRALASALRRGERAATVYLRGSLTERGAVYGLSDIDLKIVTPGDPGAPPGTASARIRQRAKRVANRMPGRLEELLECHVFEQEHLAARGAEPILVYGLDCDRRGAAARSVYFDGQGDWDRVALHARPGLFGPMSDWRLVSGEERRPELKYWDRDHQRLAAWLELQFWWWWTAAFAERPNAPGAAYTAVKLVAEPARICLWLSEGVRCESRVEALVQARDRLPAEAASFEEALDLHRHLAQRPTPDVARTLGALTKLSSLIAQCLVRDAEVAGLTPVSLRGAADGDLMLAQGGWTGPVPASAPKPLADWRAVAWPRSPDETFVTLDGSPAEAAVLAACNDVERGPFPTLVSDGLLIRPTGDNSHRRHLRTVHCPISDPVSFALNDGASVAQFPSTPGWSARDWARRATAEHAAWLTTSGAPLEPSGETLGMLVSAVRAALFLASVESGNPRLPLTIAATLEALAEESESDRETAESAAEAYADFVANGGQPPAGTVRGLERVVRRLPAYAAWETA
jgi:hypothetical protein